MHFQKAEAAQSKLVRCVEGEILDVIVDVRPQSPTFGQHISVILNSIQKKQLFVPRGFAHGYMVLSTQLSLRTSVITITNHLLKEVFTTLIRH